MKIKQFTFPFTKHHSFLMNKWWHRFFVVAYVIITLGFLIGSYFISLESIGEKAFNITIKNNLRDFSKNSDKSITNTVPLFLEQGGKIGCFENNKMAYVSTYGLENETFCSADISAHLDEAAGKIIGDGSLTFEKRKELLSEALTNDTEKRYCFIRKEGVDCLSNNIISYERNFIYYLQAIVYSLIATYIFSIILQIVYFKGLIFIIYGKNIEENKKQILP